MKSFPGATYFIPDTQEQDESSDRYRAGFFHSSHVCQKPMRTLQRRSTSTYTGISPVIANEICHRASIDGDQAPMRFSEEAALHLYHNFSWMMEDVKNRMHLLSEYHYERRTNRWNSVPSVFQCYEDSTCSGLPTSDLSSSGTVLCNRETHTPVSARNPWICDRSYPTPSSGNRKKYELQKKQLKDTEKREKYKVYGELIHTYGYQLEEGCKGS